MNKMPNPDAENLRKSQKAWAGLVKLSNLFSSVSTILPSSFALGRLAFKEEPGKVRVFAMADCITQWVLHPLHKFLFSILRKLSSVDATFDQDKGVQIILSKLASRECKDVYSLDLSAATDRLPLILQIHLLNVLLPRVGWHWANLLVNRDYAVPNHPTLRNNPLKVRYGCGQPMGAYSSWAMLAVTHHFIVQYCAHLVYPNLNKLFQDYMVLGDDLLVLDKKVALKYLEVMKLLGVGVNMHKSLVSNLGYGEFAKRFLSPQGEIQGVSLREFNSLNSIASLIAVGSKLNVSMSSFLLTLGFGSKSSGHATLPFSRLSFKSCIHHICKSPLLDPSVLWYNWFVSDNLAKIDWEYYSQLTGFLHSLEIAKDKLVSHYWTNVVLPRSPIHTRKAALWSLITYLLGSPFYLIQPIDHWASDHNEWIKSLSDILQGSDFMIKLCMGSNQSIIKDVFSWTNSFTSLDPSSFLSLPNDELRSLILFDPKDWFDAKLTSDDFNTNHFFSQVPALPFYKPRSIKDVSLFLQIKKDFFDTLDK